MSVSKVFFGLALTTSMVLTTTAYGKDEHPRREEVNRRVRNEERRIEKGLKDGTITPEQAKQMRSELAGVKAEEKAEVQANDGSLSKYEQNQLNQELNQDSRQIKADESKHPRIEEVSGRIDRQEKRVTEGRKDNELSAKEVKQLRGEEAGVKAQEKADIKANGGYLTKTEQKQLNKELNQDSRQIKADENKHPRIEEVNARIENQERRISAGKKDDQLTKKEVQQLRGEEAGVMAQETAEVKANGGYLTKGEQKQLNQELNQDSKQIHRERVDGE